MTKVPANPKPLHELIAQESENLPTIFKAAVSPTPEGKYLHWDKLRHLTPPDDLTNEQWWLAVRLARSTTEHQLPLTDTQGRPFYFNMPPLVTQYLHEIDSRASGRIAMPSEVSSSETKTRYLVRSLIEEAITSSQLEGASTTRQRAMEMFRSGKKPSDRSELMIFNNLRGMEFIRQHQNDVLTPGLVLGIHKEMMVGTIDDSSLGRLQTVEDERVNVVSNLTQEVVHRPPAADQLEARLKELCRFANAEGESEFFHPVIRAILLHLWLAYDHPFEDGNGRTARALFYWYMLNSGYWLFEFISISSVLRQASGQYARAFLYTETDANDATYFLVHQLQVIHKALESLENYLEKKSREIRHAERVLKEFSAINHRQLALLSHALRKPNADFTINSHKISHRIAYGTARSDLLELVEYGLLSKRTIGNAMHFSPGKALSELMKSKKTAK
jgi:Fic family protein